MTQPRFDKLNASLRTSDLDAVILNPGPTLTYLTGLRFHLMERPIVLLFAKDQDRRTLAVTDELLGLGERADDLDPNTSGSRQILLHELRPGHAGKLGVGNQLAASILDRWRVVAFVQIDQRNSQPIIRLLPESLAK